MLTTRPSGIDQGTHNYEPELRKYFAVATESNQWGIFPSMANAVTASNLSQVN